MCVCGVHVCMYAGSCGGKCVCEGTYTCVWRPEENPTLDVILRNVTHLEAVSHWPEAQLTSEARLVSH